MFTLYSADFINAPSNCSYPHKTEVRDAADLAAAVSRDYVCAEYMNHYRNGENFLGSDCLPVDCDNDHSENPADWVTPADVQAAFPWHHLRRSLQPFPYAREERQTRSSQISCAVSH